MKNLVSVCLLMVLAACGGKSNDDKKLSLDFFQESFEAAMVKQEVGNVLMERTTGQEYESDYDRATRTFSVKIVDANHVKKEIILKIEGDLIHKYIEDGNSREVVLISADKWSREMSSWLENTTLSEQGIYVWANFNNDVETGSIDEDSGIYMNLSYNLAYSLQMNKLDIICDATSTQTHSNASYNFKGVVTPLDNVTNSTRMYCEKKLTKTELKKLNLTNITFCDSATDEYKNCEDGKDMSFLVTEL